MLAEWKKYTVYLEMFAKRNFREFTQTLKFANFIFANGRLSIYIVNMHNILV